MSKNKNETLNLDTPTTTEKEAKMTKTVDQMSVEELREALVKKEGEGKRKRLVEELADVALSTVEDFLAVLAGDKVIVPVGGKVTKTRAPRGSKAPKEKKEWEISNGKPFFGGEEIKATKKDKSGNLRIVKAGKGLPPEVAKVENAEVKALLLALPIKK